MEGLGWFSFLIVGLLAGWIAEKIMSRDQGLLTNLIVGVVGAYLGAFLFSLLGINAGGFIGSLIVAIIGGRGAPVDRRHGDGTTGSLGRAHARGPREGLAQPQPAALSARPERAARSEADLSWPQAAMMSSPRGVRMGEA